MEMFLASGGLLDDLGIRLEVWATQVVIFITTFIVLSRLLFRRTLDFMTAREEELRKAREELARDRAEVSRLLAEYQGHLAKIDKDAYDRMQAIFKEALAAANALVARAQAEARQEVEKALAEIAREKEAAAGRLRKDVKQLSLDVASKVLAMPIDPALHGVTLDRFISENGALFRTAGEGKLVPEGQP